MSRSRRKSRGNQPRFQQKSLARLREASSPNSIKINPGIQLPSGSIPPIPLHFVITRRHFPIDQRAHFTAEQVVDFQAHYCWLRQLIFNHGFGVEGVGVVLRQAIAGRSVDC
ncbi:MAG: hypothetical protein DKINENOH_03950 [bacterium]|nr:hypothetical protein [bacterium]